MTDQELIALDQIGLIPAPSEDEQTFCARVENTRKRYETGDWIPESHWDWVREFLYEVFHVKPLYICAFYSNRNLTPWQGAAAWIEESKWGSVQLREGFRKGRFLGVGREEILAHEAVHGIRSAFPESRFEEFFAYMTSEKKWRRVLGPIFRRPWEAWPFILCMVGGIFWPIFYSFAALWTAIGFWRLIREHRLLNRAATHLYQRVQSASKARAILFRLTDEEILEIVKAPQSIDQWVLEKNCLRWRVIRFYL